MYKNYNFWEAGHPAIIAYTGRSAFWFLKGLHQDFRHCLVIVQVPPLWVVVDSLANRLSLAVLDLQGLAEFLATLHRNGYRCQVTRTRAVPQRQFSILPCTCVEMVKRAIGILDRTVLTPRQLFNRIKRNNLTTKILPIK